MITIEQQKCKDLNRLADNSDSIRRDMQRIANSLEELVKCLENNNRS